MKVFKTSRITFQRKADPPSIPSPGKAYGYEEAPDGSLRPQEIPHQDSSMGPAYYNINHVREFFWEAQEIQFPTLNRIVK